MLILIGILMWCLYPSRRMQQCDLQTLKKFQKQLSSVYLNQKGYGLPKVLITNKGELTALFSGLAQTDRYPLNLTYSRLGNRSLSQNGLQHSIYGEISKYLISKGRTDCNADWIKDMLKSKFLGWIEETFTDIVTGEKFTKEVLRKTSELDTGEAYHYTTQIIDWSESIGCIIKIPANSVYMKLMEQQEL